MLNILKKIWWFITWPFNVKRDDVKSWFGGSLSFWELNDNITGGVFASVIYVPIICLFIFLYNSHNLNINFITSMRNYSSRKVEIQLVNNQLIINPKSIAVNAGEILLFNTEKKQCFFMSGDGESNTYPLYSKKIYISVTLPHGEKRRISDITSYARIKEAGLVIFNVEGYDTKTYKSWCGSNPNAKTLSQFNIEKVNLYINNIKRIPDDVLPILFVKEKRIYGKSAIAKVFKNSLDKNSVIQETDSTREIEEIIKRGRSTLKSVFNSLFNKPITNTNYKE